MKKQYLQDKNKILYSKYMSSISQLINHLYCLIYCTYTSKPKSLSFTCSHSFSFVVPLVIICCHSLSLVASLVVTRCYSLSLIVSLVATRCYSLPLFVIRCHWMHHSCLFVNDRNHWLNVFQLL